MYSRIRPRGGKTEHEDVHAIVSIERVQTYNARDAARECIIDLVLIDALDARLLHRLFADARFDATKAFCEGLAVLLKQRWGTRDVSTQHPSGYQNQPMYPCDYIDVSSKLIQRMLLLKSRQSSIQRVFVIGMSLDTRTARTGLSEAPASRASCLLGNWCMKGHPPTLLQKR